MVVSQKCFPYKQCCMGFGGLHLVLCVGSPISRCASVQMVIEFACALPEVSWGQGRLRRYRKLVDNEIIFFLVLLLVHHVWKIFIYFFVI